MRLGIILNNWSTKEIFCKKTYVQTIITKIWKIKKCVERMVLHQDVGKFYNLKC